MQQDQTERTLKTAIGRRAKARKMRGMMRDDPQPQLTDVLNTHVVSRPTYYRLLAELEAWEAKATPEQEAAEINAMYPERSSTKWILISGKALLAYAKGEIDDVLHGKHQSIAVEPTDELLD
jgi:hypothetical protein